jgi:hypothetical protein
VHFVCGYNPGYNLAMDDSLSGSERSDSETTLETELVHLIGAVAQQCLPFATYPCSNEILAESNAAELLDSGRGPGAVLSAEDVTTQFAELILDYYTVRSLRTPATHVCRA